MPKQTSDDRALEYVRSAGGPVSAEEVQDALEGDYARATIRGSLRRLEKEGKIVQVKTGVYRMPSGDALPGSVNKFEQEGDPLYDVTAEMGDGSYEVNERQIGYITGERAMGTPGKDVFWVFVRGDSMGERYRQHSMVPCLRFEGTMRDIREDGVYLFRLENAVQIKRLQRLSGQRIRVISDNDAYPEQVIQIDEGVDFQILGRVLV